MLPSLVLLVLVLGQGPTPDPAAIERAIERGAEALCRSYEDELRTHLRQTGPPGPLAAASRPGERALLAYTLLEAQVEGPDAPPGKIVARIVAGLSFEEIEHTYDVACTLLLLGEQDARAHREWIESLAQQLLAWQERGDWGYPAGSDLSNTQYAALGLWAAMRAGVELSPEVWMRLAEAVLEYRTKPGGFAYRASGWDATGSMTAAGIGTLALCEMELARHGALAPDFAAELRAARTRALAWLADAFRVDVNPHLDSWTHYWLYGLERMASFGGLARLGTHDWYAEGASWLLRTQREEGNWQGRLETCFAVLFLERAALRALEPRSGPEAYAESHASPRDALVRLGVRLEGGHVALRVAGFSPRGIAPHEWPGEAGRGPRVLRVEYREGDACLAVALGDAERPGRGSSFPATSWLASGEHRIRARVFVLAQPTDERPGSGSPETPEIRILESPEVPVEVTNDAARPVEPDPLARNLLGPGVHVQARASSTLSGLDFLSGVGFEAARAVDGMRRRPWLARADDARPELELSLRKGVRADLVLLVPPRLAGFPADELGRPLEVEVLLNAKVVGRVLMPPDPSRVARLELDEPLLVHELRLRILSRAPGRSTAAVGLGEVGLELRSVR